MCWSEFVITSCLMYSRLDIWKWIHRLCSNTHLEIVRHDTQCTRRHTLYDTTYNVRDDIQCTRRHTMYETTYNVRDYIQCTRRYTMYETTYNVRDYIHVRDEIQCRRRHTLYETKRQYNVLTDI